MDRGRVVSISLQGLRMNTGLGCNASAWWACNARGWWGRGMVRLLACF